MTLKDFWDLISDKLREFMLEGVPHLPESERLREFFAKHPELEFDEIPLDQLLKRLKEGDSK